MEFQSYLALLMISVFGSLEMVLTESDVTYCVIAPKTLRPQSTYVISVTTYQPTSWLNFLVAMLQDKDGGILVTTGTIGLQTGNAKMVTMKIPDEVPENEYWLFVSGRGRGGVEFSQRHSVSVMKKTLSLFIQTDKAMYKPGQTVLFRAIAVYPDLKPYKGPMDISVYDTADNKILQLLQQKNDTGVITNQLALSDQTVLGNWQIKVVVKGDSFTKKFEVAEYVLPKFEVKVDLPSYYFVNKENPSSQTDLLVTVTAKYTYGKPVKGSAVVNIRLLRTNSWYNYVYPPAITKTVQLIDGKADLTLTVEELKNQVPSSSGGYPRPGESLTKLSESKIFVAANVTETVTGIVLSGNSSVQCVSQMYSLSFLDFSPDNFKPGLLYYGYLQLKQADQSAPKISDIKKADGSYKSVIITATMYFAHDYFNKQLPLIKQVIVPITDSGFMEFVFEINGSNIDTIRLEAKFEEKITASKSISPFKSRDQEGIQLSFSSEGGVIKPDTTVAFAVKTTKPINSFEYQVLAKGTLQKSSIVSGAQSTDHHFTIYVSPTFAVQLAPEAKVVVWYITGNGEMIADSVSVSVRDSFANRVSLSFDKDMTGPSASVNLTIRAHQNSYVGLLAVDQSVLLLSTGNDISQDMALDDIAGYVTGKVDLSPRSRFCWWWPRNMGGVDTFAIIENAGLFTLTDAHITKNSRQRYHEVEYMEEVQARSSLRMKAKANQAAEVGAPAPRDDDAQSVQTRTNFPETWLWTDLFSGLATHHHLTSVTPTSHAVARCPASMHATDNYDYTDSEDLYEFAFAAFDSPGNEEIVNQASSGDIVESIPTRVRFPETWLWIDAVSGPNGQITIEAKVPDTITSWVASAFAMSDSVGLGIANNPAKVTVFKDFFVSLNLPYSIIRGEEFALQVTVFNYLSETLPVTVNLPRSTYFKVRVHTNSVMDDFSSENEISNGSDSSDYALLTETIVVKSNDASSVYFWIIPTALGQIPIEVQAVSGIAGDAARVMLLVKPEGIVQQYSTSTFIQLSDGRQYNGSLTVSLPPKNHLVPDSAFVEVTAIGDIMGPSLNGLANLLQMPCGCGEQNMLNFAPDVYIMKYLSVSNQLMSDIAQKARQFMNAGYQRELTYQRQDGSFSAFGDSDKSGSVWLSAFVIKCFHQAKEYIPVEDEKIARTLNWIMMTQSSDGSFKEPPEGRVLHSDMQVGKSRNKIICTTLQPHYNITRSFIGRILYNMGGSSSGVSMTAYVLIALLENEDNSKVNSAALERSSSKAVQYLESHLHSVESDPYALSIISYALLLAGSSKSSDALDLLEALAKNEGGMKHWEKAASTSETEKRSWRPPYQQAQSVNIEMTSYVLLIYATQKDITKGLPVTKWLIKQRNANGGFSSTQDTVMALEALSMYSGLLAAPSGSSGLKVTVAGDHDSSPHAFTEITSQTSLLYQSVELPGSTKLVTVNATGRGSALVQLNVKYNVNKTENAHRLRLRLNHKNKGNEIVLKACSKWLDSEVSGMVVLEINQLTGYAVNNKDNFKQQMGSNLKRIEINDNKIILYLDQLTGSYECVEVRSSKVHMVKNVKEAPVKVYRYYEPSAANVAFYSQSVQSVSVDCCDSSSNGPQISHLLFAIVPLVFRLL